VNPTGRWIQLKNDHLNRISDWSVPQLVTGWDSSVSAWTQSRSWEQTEQGGGNGTAVSASELCGRQQ